MGIGAAYWAAQRWHDSWRTVGCFFLGIALLPGLVIVIDKFIVSPRRGRK